MAKSTTRTLSLVLNETDVKNSVKTIELSKKYVKRLIKISLLNIAYHRIDIPQSEFVPKSYENVPYMIFKKKSQNKFIRTYHSFAKGIMEAIEKDYLKEISMYILDKKTREPLETYNIKLKYNKEDTTSDKKPAMIKAATMEFLKTFTELPGKKWQEDTVEVFIELSYNKGVPKEYEPPHFEAAKETMSSHSTKFVSLGKINTGFHKISVWGRGKNLSDSRASTPASALLDKEDILGEEEGEHIILQTDKATADTDNNIDNEEGRKLKKRKMDCSFADTTNDGNWETMTIISSADFINCLCKWDLPEEYETVRCTKCFGFVHIACHGFASLEAIDKDKFTCFCCSDSKHVKDDYLNMKVKLRVILYGIFVNKCIPAELQLTSKDERIYILKRLEKLGIRSKLSTSIQDINFKALNEAMKLVFQEENSQYLE